MEMLSLNKANITYIYHSGFIVETLNNILVFDYYKGLVYDKLIKSKKNIIVFVSHKHEDHFNKDIFNWRKFNENIKYVLSSDAAKDIDTKDIISITRGEKIKIDGVTVKAYGSTDEGVSFMIYVDNLNLFHAGDLNWWYWKEDSTKENDLAGKWFKREIQNIIGENIDVAFFPVDPRQEEFYHLGAEYFIEKLNPTLFIPMHFGDNLDITFKFHDRIKKTKTTTAVITKPGENIEF